MSTQDPESSDNTTHYEGKPKNLASKIGRGFVNTIYGLGALLAVFIVFFLLTDGGDDDAGSTATAAAAPPPAVAPAATPAPAVDPTPVEPSGPSPEFLALVKKIEAPNALGAPMALDAAGLQRFPAHGEMLNNLSRATSRSPQSEHITALNDDPAFAMVYFDCYGEPCKRRQAQRISYAQLPVKDKAEAAAKASVFTRCSTQHQSHAEWPREVFRCVMTEYDSLIELNDRMSQPSPVAQVEQMKGCLAQFIQGNQARFSEANACVADATRGPQVGYTFAKR